MGRFTWRVENGVTGQAKKNVLAVRLDRAIAADEEGRAVSYGELAAVLDANRSNAKQERLMLEAFGLSGEGLVRGAIDPVLIERLRSGEVEEHSTVLAPEGAGLPDSNVPGAGISKEEWRKMSDDGELAPETTRAQYISELLRFAVS